MDCSHGSDMETQVVVEGGIGVVGYRWCWNITFPFVTEFRKTNAKYDVKQEKTIRKHYDRLE